MITDNLKNINSVADLFRYIANIEEENEMLHKQIDSLLIQLDKNSTKPEVGFKRDPKDYNINVRKREL